MAAPEHVPIDPTRPVRRYTSPPRRPDPWTAGRPGELSGRQPSGPALGTAGPDQGYAFRLVPLFDDKLFLGDVGRADAVAGCVALAMKRSGLFGRGPVVHDLTAAFTIYGFLDGEVPAELGSERAELFAEVANHHHYSELRHLVDRVDAEWLRRSHDDIAAQYRADWRAFFPD